VRLHAANCIGNLGHQDRGADLDHLATKDKDIDVKVRVAGGAGGIGPDARDVAGAEGRPRTTTRMSAMRHDQD
jgi:hypothetical protein